LKEDAVLVEITHGASSGTILSLCDSMDHEEPEHGDEASYPPLRSRAPGVARCRRLVSDA